MEITYTKMEKQQNQESESKLSDLKSSILSHCVVPPLNPLDYHGPWGQFSPISSLQRN